MYLIGKASKGACNFQYLETIPFPDFIRKRDVFAKIEAEIAKEMERETKK